MHPPDLLKARQMPYSTDDELTFLRSIAAHNHLENLVKLRIAYAAREWAGDGMDVDRDRILAELDSLIATTRAVAQGKILGGIQ